MEDENKNARIAFRTKDEIKDSLKKQADKLEISLSELINRILLKNIQV